MTCNRLPPELLGLIFSHMQDEERCHVIPLVSREFLQIHKAYPPRRTHWEITKSPKGFQRPMGTWLLGIAPHLETLSVDMEDPHDLGCLPQMLMCAMHAPKLKELYIGGAKDLSYESPMDWGPIFLSLSFLSQVKVLHINNWEYHGDGTGEMHCLAGLTSLEEVTLTQLDWADVEFDQTEALWKALASLKYLRFVGIQFYDSLDGEDLDGHLSGMSKLTKIRSLVFEGGALLLNEIETDCIGTLVQLSSLRIAEVLGHRESLYPILGLPSLMELHIELNAESEPPASHAWKSESLTSLTIGPGPQSRGLHRCQDWKFQVEEIISLQPAALARLQNLALPHWHNVDTFPASLAAALKTLLVLKLDQSAMKRLPPTVACIKTLREFSMEGDKQLQLQRDDITTLAALPDLRVFRVSKKLADDDTDSKFRFTEQSVGVLLAISRRLPQLRLPGIDIYE